MLTSFQAPANPSPLRAFHGFPHLPLEIRVNIWNQALSDIDCHAIRVIINFDLDHPRAIVSAPWYPPSDLSEVDEDGIDYDSDFSDTPDPVAPPPSRIPAMLHACPESRTIALTRYRLDLHSNIPDENTPWWNPEEDTVYLPSFQYKHTTWKGLRTSLSSVQYLALPLTKAFLDVVAPNPLMPYKFPLNSFFEWILNLPHLKALTLLVDPFGKYDAGRGRIIQHEPYDVPIHHLNSYRPSQIEKLIMKIIGTLKSPEDPPSVEVLVMGFSKL
jgi:hypothetical protein